MQVTSQRRDWEDLSALDPYWSILSDPERRYGGWDLEDFLESGVTDVERILQEGQRFGLPFRHERALDFGCGAGRLTRALAPHFDECLGLDISERMIVEAERVNADVPACRFVHTDAADLAAFPDASFDFVLSSIVLQHVPGAMAKTRYISEFVRVLRPGGLLAFQLLSHLPLRHRLQPRPRLYGVLRRLNVSPETLYHRLHLNPIRMTALGVAEVHGVLERAGGRAVDVAERRAEGGAVSANYLVTKNR